MKRFSDYVEQYISERDLKPASITNYRLTVRLLDKWHGSPVKFKKLSDDLLNSFLSDYLERGVSRHTVKSRRTILLVLARAAFEAELSKYEPRRVKAIRCPRPDVDVWTVDEMRRLLDGCDMLEGSFRRTRIPRAAYMRALFACAWDTGLRRSDLLDLTCDQVLTVGPFRVVQRKTQSAKPCRVNEWTQEQFRLTLATGPRVLAFPLWAEVDQLVRLAKRVMRHVGLTSNRHHIFHKIRRSSITHVESLHTGTGWLHGGHSDPSITQRHYIDPNTAYESVPLPTSLAG